MPVKLLSARVIVVLLVTTDLENRHQKAARERASERLRLSLSSFTQHVVVDRWKKDTAEMPEPPGCTTYRANDGCPHQPPNIPHRPTNVPSEVPHMRMRWTIMCAAVLTSHTLRLYLSWPFSNHTSHVLSCICIPCLQKRADKHFVPHQNSRLNVHLGHFASICTQCCSDAPCSSLSGCVHTSATCGARANRSSCANVVAGSSYVMTYRHPRFCLRSRFLRQLFPTHNDFRLCAKSKWCGPA